MQDVIEFGLRVMSFLAGLAIFLIIVGIPAAFLFGFWLGAS